MDVADHAAVHFAVLAGVLMISLALLFRPKRRPAEPQSPRIELRYSARSPCSTPERKTSAAPPAARSFVSLPDSRIMPETPNTVAALLDEVPFDMEKCKSLPPCAFRPGVSEAERDELCSILKNPKFAQSAAPHEGLLALGTARQIIAVPPSSRRDVERQRLLREFAEVLEWRERAEADTALARGLPPELLSGAELHSWEYGRTAAGLPVFVDQASSWLSAVRVSRRRGLTPSDFGKQRVYWHEKCLALCREQQAQGIGNGQYVHIIDCGDLAISLSDIHASWPYIKEATVGVALNYGGCCARIYVARPPRIFSLAWRLLRPFLTEATNAKVATVSPRGSPPRTEHYDFSHLTKMEACSLPKYLGGSVEAAVRPMHYVASSS